MLDAAKGFALLRCATPLRVSASARGALLKLSGRGTPEGFDGLRRVEQGTLLNKILTKRRKCSGCRPSTEQGRTMPNLTLCQAAKVSGRTKATISEAIKKGRISARK